MKKNLLATGFALWLALLPVGAWAQIQQTQPAPPKPVEKHDSNTLHKIGKAVAYPFRKAGENTSKAAHQTASAVQYPVRKAGENASVTTHKSLGHKSVVHNRQTGQNQIVAPATTVTPVPDSKH